MSIYKKKRPCVIFASKSSKKSKSQRLNFCPNTSKDDLELGRGQARYPSFLKEESNNVVFFSKDYASSSSGCLEEHAKIHDEKKHVVPIFYNIDPSNVRYQLGSFAEHFRIHEEVYQTEPKKLLRWKAALTEVASIAGWNSNGQCESSLVKEVVKLVWPILNPGLSFPSSPRAQSATPSPSTTCFSTSSDHHKVYDVFISFRGKDIRTNFFGHLYNALVEHGISAFRDDMHLDRGKPVYSELVKRIKESKICLVIFSPNFAESRWCLDEVAEIIESKNRASSSIVRNMNGISMPFDRNEQVNLENRERVALMPTPRVDATMCKSKDSCELSQLGLLVNYNGKWVKSEYVGGKTKGILVSKYISRWELKDQAYRIVHADPKEYRITMKAKYESKGATQPVEIHDEGDLRFFISKSLQAGCNIPLCLTVEPRKDYERMRKIWAFSLFCLLAILVPPCFVITLCMQTMQ